jgi:glycosyltransferase involved in cell wall biosynthesis
VDKRKIPDNVNKKDVFVVPNPIESFGVAAIEALACERPCIVAITWGLPEVANHRRTGIFA